MIRKQKNILLIFIVSSAWIYFVMEFSSALFLNENKYEFGPVFTNRDPRHTVSWQRSRIKRTHLDKKETTETYVRKQRLPAWSVVPRKHPFLCLRSGWEDHLFYKAAAMSGWHGGNIVTKNSSLGALLLLQKGKFVLQLYMAWKWCHLKTQRQYNMLQAKSPLGFMVTCISK